MGLSDLDQHFMIDKDLIKKIAEYSDLREKDVVLEIGPGKGFLTRELVKKCRVIAVEKDESFKKELLKLCKLNKNLMVVFDNALEVMKQFKFNKLVANIPYNLSEPLLKKLFRNPPDMVIITISKSFANKISSKKFKIGIQTQFFFTVEIKEEVSRNSFMPKPKTDSAVVKLIPREEESLSVVEIVLRRFVLLDKKKTKNALMESLVEGLDLTKRKAKDIIDKLDIPTTILEKNSDLLSFAEFSKVKSKLTLIIEKQKIF